MFGALAHYADFKRRAGRAEFWRFVLLLVAVNAGLLAALLGIAEGGGDAEGPTDVALGVPGAVLLIAALLFDLAMITPAVSVTVRRLHDTGKSATWLWVLVLPLIGPVVLLVLTLLEGAAGTNRYGPDPRRGAADTSLSGGLL